MLNANKELKSYQNPKLKKEQFYYSIIGKLTGIHNFRLGARQGLFLYTQVKASVRLDNWIYTHIYTRMYIHVNTCTQVHTILTEVLGLVLY